jgi:hypothetical protein
VFALITILLELIALGPMFIFFYTLLGADGAGELNPEYDFTDDFTAEDYPTPGSRPTEFENLQTLQYSLLALYFICMLMNLALPILNIMSLTIYVYKRVYTLSFAMHVLGWE